MSTEAELMVEERIVRLLQHLGIRQAHFGARVGADWSGIAGRHPEAISSLTLVCPVAGTNPSILRPLGSKLLVINAEVGETAERVRHAVFGSV